MASIRELIDRMKHGDFHEARDEAARLTDLDALEQLKSTLGTAKDVTERKYCYWILGYLGHNTNAPQVADYLMERVPLEKTGKWRVEALRQALFIESAWNPENAIAAIGDKNRDVRRAAIAALGACTDPRAEEALIRVAESDADADPVAMREATVGLARNGTEKCADALISLVRCLPCNGHHEVTISAALLALARLGRRDVLPLAADALQGWRYNLANWARMHYIAQLGNEEHIDVVIGRLKSIVQRKNRQDMTYRMTYLKTRFDDELSAGVTFLQRFTDKRIGEFFAFLRDHVGLLLDREKSYLAANHTDLEIGNGK